MFFNEMTKIQLLIGDAPLLCVYTSSIDKVSGALGQTVYPKKYYDHGPKHNFSKINKLLLDLTISLTKISNNNNRFLKNQVLKTSLIKIKLKHNKL